MSETSEGETIVEGMGFAIPSEDVLKITKYLERDGMVKRPILGIDSQAIASLSSKTIKGLKIPQTVQGGLLITKVAPNFPANQAGLKVGDVIVQMNTQIISSAATLQSKLYQFKVGDQVQLAFYREGKLLSKIVTLKQTTSDLKISNIQK